MSNSPHQSLSTPELLARVDRNLANQSALAGARNAAAKRALALLKADMVELVEERNRRDEMRELPW